MILIKGGVISEASRNTRYGTESVVKTAIRNLLLCYYSRRFRISELTSNVPYAVRSTLRNDGKGDFRINSVVCKTTAIFCLFSVRDITYNSKIF